MRSIRLLAFWCAAAYVFPSAAKPQDQLANPAWAQLELTMEVATTTGDGLPAALRFTLTNTGSVAVDLPKPSISCPGSPVGDIRIETVVRFDGPKGTVGGGGCGGSFLSNPSILVQIKTTWFHLRPGEYLTFTGDRRTMIYKASAPATYEYHAVYDPPHLTPEERKLAAQHGYLVPSEAVESDTRQYHER